MIDTVTDGVRCLVAKKESLNQAIKRLLICGAGEVRINLHIPIFLSRGCILAGHLDVSILSCRRMGWFRGHFVGGYFERYFDGGCSGVWVLRVVVCVVGDVLWLNGFPFFRCKG